MAPALSPSTARVLGTLIREGPTSRMQLARMTGLTPGGITRAISPLVDSGLVRETAARPAGGRGRPATALEVQADRELQVGVKVTATGLVAVLCDLRCRVLAEHHEELRGQDPPTVLEQVAELVRRWCREHPRVRRAGLSLSGDVDPSTGQVGYSPFLGWRDLPVGRLLAGMVDVPVVVENDVRALLTGEHMAGTGAGAHSLAMVTIGAGIGCALLLEGRVVHGSHGVLGEIGHVLADSAGPRCHCGNVGCVEALAGEAAVLEQMAGRGHPGLTVPEVVAMARAGSADAREVLAGAGRAIGIGLATLANLFGPAVIVLTGEAVGGPDGDYDVMAPSVREEFARRAFGSAADCELVLRPLTFTDWARGAAACAVAALLTSRAWNGEAAG
ncbi:ROK family protein [Auraticoccus sp. F435]|uniref:ROK family protein n=1 Tax=Auraticoccus cholistanensis TaxID=2656650 RepID=A0A6A9URK8_9ACTN|nr:ROK family transcriptional regulator [Auraticoccus cholistanensis]MVA75311.1 ROK family protein [Auraticoccus cholistanensis]